MQLTGSAVYPMLFAVMQEEENLQRILLAALQEKQESLHIYENCKCRTLLYVF
jgi:hypothetical protein